MNRRQFIKGTLCAIAALSIPGTLAQAAVPVIRAEVLKEFPIKLYNTQTKERLQIMPSDIRNSRLKRLQFEHFLRDSKTNVSSRMDLRLVDILQGLQDELGTEIEFRVLSGYRTPQSNAKLVKNRAYHAAKKSLHVRGKALDITINGVSTRKMFFTAKKLQVGGVGFYPKSRFIHVDTGDIRTWKA